MNNKQQTLQKINELEAQLEVLKKDLEQKFPTIQEAKIGDVLEDGSIVVEKTTSMALLVAPLITEAICGWTPEFTPVFNKLKEKGFTPSQWFIPTKEQLKIALQNCNTHFGGSTYWSSDSGWCVNVYDSSAYIAGGGRGSARYVLAFRVVNF
jgi:hypothetical protein